MLGAILPFPACRACVCVACRSVLPMSDIPAQTDPSERLQAAAARRLLDLPGGAEALAGLAARFQPAGVFAGSDWDEPSACSHN